MAERDCKHCDCKERKKNNAPYWPNKVPIGIMGEKIHLNQFFVHKHLGKMPSQGLHKNNINKIKSGELRKNLHPYMINRGAWKEIGR